MSRIPKPGFTPSSAIKEMQGKAETMVKKTSGSNLVKMAQENKTESSWKKTSGSNLRSGFKRPSEENLAAITKRQKNEMQKNAISSISTVKRKVFGAASSSFPQERFTAIDKAKRVALEPIPDTGVRNSMPAVVSSAGVKIPGKSKRPAWDLKGRIQDMEENFIATQERNANLKRDLEAYNERIAALEAANSRLHQDVEIKSVQSEEASSEILRLESLLRQKKEECETLASEKEKENDKRVKEIQLLNKELSTLKDEYDNLKNTYQHETNVLKSSISSLTCMKSGIQAQLEATELMLTNARTEIQQLKSLLSFKESEIESLSQQCSSLENKLRDEETLRRKLHNVIQELKGNIRVFCRLRPPLPEELKNGMNLANIVQITEKAIEIQQLNDIGLNESGGKIQPKYEFSFDCYFSPSSSQEQIFAEITQLVQSALDGYNVCIFAYGQTGSGKTFTMEGPASIVDFIANKDHASIGMIPRSVQQIFSTIRDLEPKGWKYKVETLFLEIYNERIQDLLNTNSGNTKCEIIKSGSKGTDCIISNVNPIAVTSAEEVYELMKKARINRVVAATKCNEYSSRSHYVFQMKLYGENSITGEKCDGTLNLVDLAGSERVKESASVGDRLTEAKAINKSLSNLGKVIMSLSRKENHIPYRDSKLTHLLANSLGGNSKTLMFVNISPDNKNLSETINSLRFATKVNQCNIGTAQKRVR